MTFLSRLVVRRACALALPVVLAACAGSGAKPKPAELAPVAATVAAQKIWNARVAPVGFSLSVQVAGDAVVLAGGDGTVAALNAATGRDIWRAQLATPLSAGVGSDGRNAAVVSQSNVLIVLRDGKELWRQTLKARAYTAPLVAGGRVFVQAADRSVSAFDGENGARLWTQQRPGDPLVLRQGGVLLAVGDTLVAGLGGRLVGLNPLNGSIRWEAPLATPRGVNDVERLVDLVGPAARQGEMVCARAFQASVGCVDASKGSLSWSRAADGMVGLAIDERLVFGTEADGKVQAWRRDDGERAWTSERLRFREPTAPAVVGRSIAIGDFEGFVHLFARSNGAVLNRLSTDGSAIAAAPVLAGNTLVVVTRSGGVFGFAPQ